MSNVFVNEAPASLKNNYQNNWILLLCILHKISPETFWLHHVYTRLRVKTGITYGVLVCSISSLIRHKCDDEYKNKSDLQNG